jgi:outer membrane protein OmpA-like peptidoglycan-associated protein
MAVEYLMEILRDIERVRQLGADQLGPTAPIVTGVGWLMSASFAIFTIIVGRGGAPPISDFSSSVVRIFGAVAGVGVVALLVWRNNGGTALEFTVVAIYSVVIGLTGSFVYLFLRYALCFRCEQDATLYVKGLRLDPHAKRVLSLYALRPADRQKVLAELPRERAETFRRNVDPPANATDYFCNSEKEVEFIWKPLSQSASIIVLYLAYFFVLVPITIGVASASIALSQPQLKQKQTAKEDIIELPADILFDFDKADIRPGAVASLQEAAGILRQHEIKEARIEGHTDSWGSPQYNHQLSERRADAVRNWLIGAGKLSNVKFTVRAFGATKPIEPNVQPDNSDNPEGRRKNRRVVIAFDKQ